MSGIVIGMDPHKVSVTIEVRDEREVLLGTGRFGTDTGGYKAMLGYCRQWPRRSWAVEGANGTGWPTAQRLLADGERVLDVPAKLAARARVFDTGNAGKTEPTTRTPSSWSRCAPRVCGSSPSRRDWRCCGCSRTGAMSCPAAAPRS